ncbi:hypothetical protein LGL55_22765 [Clostridium tagluense]|uniref:hypothetical protein n=1 Tax=Clostridium tagluense TaxID=360422 RepID=UPI001C0B5A30|nr:hypothetical protein [Clostridium tagluense]MBU3130483.1 hypothetical protein [Clostridium tagluense]MCB2311845.1 hypothetical protein [Clostridium tagluense]MCB2317399.1 hypothetical protein [Clostridium tagluense]MCB2323752.1 hypothetical protein [Clostridium tagluense]MCB2326953.1 hypothetical protein [Clostridium tagluense]
MNYMANMQRDVEFINVNANDELNLDEIARRAYMSKSYFSKIFRVITKNLCGKPTLFRCGMDSTTKIYH